MPTDEDLERDDIIFSEDRYIVIFEDAHDRELSPQAADAAVETRQALFAELNIPADPLIHQFQWSSSGFAARLPQGKAEALSRHPEVKHVARDFKYQAIEKLPDNSGDSFKQESEEVEAQPNPTSSGVPWGVNRVGGPEDGSGTRAWVLSSGIDLNHSNLNVDTDNAASFVAWHSADDGNGHGTGVAGVIGALDNNSGPVGVAPGASVVPVRVCNDSNQCYVSDVKGGVDYVAGQYSSGEVASITLGYPHDEFAHPSVDIPLIELENSIENAANDGLKFTLSAGNEGEPAEDYSPARMDHDNIWTISSIDQNDDFSTDFSNYGDATDFAAPGEDIFTTDINDGTQTVDGTSFAAPHVAGILLVDGEISQDGTANNDPASPADPIAHKPIMSVSISGPSSLVSGEQGTWSATTYNAPGSVDYTWYTSSGSGWNQQTETSDTFSHTFIMEGNHWVMAKAESINETATETQIVNIYCDPPFNPCPHSISKEEITD